MTEFEVGDIGGAGGAGGGGQSAKVNKGNGIINAHKSLIVNLFDKITGLVSPTEADVRRIADELSVTAPNVDKKEIRNLARIAAGGARLGIDNSMINEFDGDSDNAILFHAMKSIVDGRRAELREERLRAVESTMSDLKTAVNKLTEVVSKHIQTNQD